MTCIDDLFDWLLEEIFTKLNRHDRLICKEICRHWYEILMKRPIFKQDRHIYLKTSEIIAGEAPMSVILQAKIPYKIYTIHIDSKKINSDILEFFEKVGATIEEIHFEGEHIYYEILTKMISLKSISFKWWSLKEVAKTFSSIKAYKPDFTFDHLEQLQIKYLADWDKAIHNINNIKQLIPKNCSLVISNATYYKRVIIEAFPSVMEAQKINELEFDVSDIKNMKKLLELNKIKCDALKFNCLIDQSPYALIEAIQDKHQDIKKIKLLCQFLPPVGIGLLKITTLILYNLNAPVIPLKAVEQFQNLEELYFRFVPNGCLFGHESINLPKLKSIVITFTNVCNKCLKAISESFVNLVDFKFTLKTEGEFTWNDLKAVTNTWAKNLRSLSINGDIHLENEDYEMMYEKFPNLDTLTILITNVLPLSNTIRTVSPAFKKLTTFIFLNGSINDAAEMKMFFDHMNSIGFPIEKKTEALSCLETAHALQLILDRTTRTSKVGGYCR